MMTDQEVLEDLLKTARYRLKNAADHLYYCKTKAPQQTISTNSEYYEREVKRASMLVKYHRAQVRTLERIVQNWDQFDEYR